ncbi:hypothetical protein [Pseudomarimonas arenosa]|uniref:Uncharacterized protein n=1 Tax=Pseudomarimonas arenosa TaxID=2774145 RepID=A0AAW3ZN07_9GAMM|nr:hypothetical protein [Pseudomarimonas arenosa]MBD8527446.1 hypothetical protein [Pseudomarimonas arenosa]
MKLQLQQQSLRLRIAEDELAELLAGRSLLHHQRLAASTEIHARIQPVDGSVSSARRWSAQTADGLLALELRVESEALRAYADRLPCKQGLQWQIQLADGGRLEIDLEVDVRDSIGKRGHRFKQS